MIDPHDEIFSVRDILDSQLQTRDRRKIGRVADIEAETSADGSLKLTYLVVGAQALAGRRHSPLPALFRLFLLDPFQQYLPTHRVTPLEPSLYLCGEDRPFPHRP